MMINKNIKIYIAGHKGMVGSACLRILKKNGYKNLIFKSSNELDLRKQNSVNDYIKKEKPEVIINAAAKVGGILANDSYPYNFILENILIQTNLISAAHSNDVRKFIFLGSSCIYPRLSKQPIKEKYLLTDSLESTNEWYAIAKISGVKMIEAIRKQFSRDYVSLMPTNLYGTNDNFDLKSSHVLPALIRKFHEAKINKSYNVTLWGTGSPKREFLHVDDLASAVMYFIENYSLEGLYNVGTGIDLSIKELAEKIKKITDYEGKILWDNSYPDGTPRKLLDISKISSLGWKPKIKFDEGLKSTYDWYKKNEK